MSEPTPSSDTDKLAKAIESLVSKHGDEKGAIKTLLDENLELRQQKRDLKKEVTDLKSNIPAKDAVVLSGDDLKAYEAYKALGSADELKTKLEEAQKAQDSLKNYKQAETMDKVADVTGVNSAALKKLYSNYDFEITGEGEEAKAYVVDGEKKVLLSEHIDEHNSEFKASLYENEEPAPSRFPVQTPVVKSSSNGKLTPEQIRAKKASTGMYTI